MHHSFKFLVSILFVSFFTACTFGTKFVELPKSDLFVLEETTYEEIVAKYGKPNIENSVVKNKIPVKMVNYGCQTGSAAGKSWKTGVMAQRILWLYFLESNNKLIGHSFSSSYEVDATNFDVSTVEKIEKGRTTRNQVIELMGPRYGECMYPLTTDQEKRKLLYSYYETSGKVGRWEIIERYLNVTYDANGIVTDVDLTESKN